MAFQKSYAPICMIVYETPLRPAGLRSDRLKALNILLLEPNCIVVKANSFPSQS